MKETTMLIILVILLGSIGFSTAYLTTIQFDINDLVVKDYQVILTEDGHLTETFVFNVREQDEYKMLYRYWQADVVYNTSLPTPYISVLSIDSAAVSYIKEYDGSIAPDTLSSNQHSFIYSNAYNNEIGMYQPTYFSKGDHTLSIAYHIAPPVEVDQDAYHINLQLASDHIDYQHIRIVLNNSKGDIFEVYTHPQLEKTFSNNQIIITGSSPENTLLEIEFLSKNCSYGFQTNINNVVEKTRSAQYQQQLIASTMNTFVEVFRMLILCFPIIVLGLYIWNGREKKFVVPQYLCTIPKHHKPWFVNRLFYKSEEAFTIEGYYATLLDLHRRNIITMDFRNKHMKIHVNEQTEHLDRYEKKIISFLKRWGKHDTFDADEISRRIEQKHFGTFEAISFKREFDRIRYHADTINIKNYIVGGRTIPAILLGLGIITFFAMVLLFAIFGHIHTIITRGILFTAVFSIQCGIITAIRPSFLGHWKKTYYKEKVEWQSFRNFLSDMAQLKKYEIQDLSIWKEWLIYATALGIGDKIVNAMKQLNIDVDEMHYYPLMISSFVHINTTYQQTYAPKGSGSSGGGFGGGGFGGGGAGGR